MYAEYLDKEVKAFFNLSVNIILLGDKPTIIVFHLRVPLFLYQGY